VSLVLDQVKKELLHANVSDFAPERGYANAPWWVWSEKDVST
jgi:hypothetical protein